HSNPSRMPSTSTASNRARIVAAPITLLIPGAGPPPTRIASVFRSVMILPRASRGLGAPLAPREDGDRRHCNSDPHTGGPAQAPRPLGRCQPVGFALERRDRRFQERLPAPRVLRRARHGPASRPCPQVCLVPPRHY